jgi:hypothetical protein
MMEADRQSWPERSPLCAGERSASALSTRQMRGSAPSLVQCRLDYFVHPAEFGD